jgi:hypothetical protein
VTEKSWITELRKRLEAPPPRALSKAAERHAALVPLYVEGGQLWLAVHRTDYESSSGGAVFPSAPLANGDDAWRAAGAAADATPGLEAKSLLRLGVLDQIEAPTGEVLIPCVAVIPPPAENSEQPSEQTGLPLTAARSPQLIEERPIRLDEREVWIRIAHFGPVKMAGVGVDIVQTLLERVFDA